jgi:hypothetical protein
MSLKKNDNYKIESSTSTTTTKATMWTSVQIPSGSMAAALAPKTADPELNFFFESNHHYRSSSTTTTAAAAAAQHQQKSGSLSNLP